MNRQDLDPGVPLGHYRQHKANVLLICNGCALSRSLPLDAVVARLQARGVGGDETGIRAVARLTNRPCPRCGKTDFQSRPHFPSIPGQSGFAAPRG